LGLAYASEALAHNNRSWGTRAISLLQETLADNPDDRVAAEQLAQFYDRMGRAEACELFGKVVRESLPGTGALVNFGNCEANRGDMEAAMKLWSQALQRNPGLEAARLNLAVAQYRSGNVEAARTNLRTALKYDPFSQRARQLLQSMPDK
jgi:tetratricopeptide (TPR) repeat protein